MKLHIYKTVAAPTTLVEFIAQHCALSKSSIKKALNFGGGWLQASGKGSPQRCRRATKALTTGDVVNFYYDDQLYGQSWPVPMSIAETRHWGVWYKPVNLVAQGTPYGDEGCMENQVLSLSGQKQVFLVHRLDREAAGLMIFAYSRQAAAALGELWRNNRVEKIYQAEVSGLLPEAEGLIDFPLDGKSALTRYTRLQTLTDSTRVEVSLQTGRLHQIRRHFALLEHPLLGDPKYGSTAAADARGLQLVATELRFDCPLNRQHYALSLPRELRLF